MTEHEPTGRIGAVAEDDATDSWQRQPGARPRGPRGRQRPWGWIVAAGLSGLVAIAAAGYGAITYQSARDWEQRAAEVQRERDEVASERDRLAESLEQTEAELSDVRSMLEDARADLSDTEDQLAAVTAEREQARDQAARLVDDLGVAANVGTDLSLCVDDLFAWLANSPTYDAGAVTWDVYFQRGGEIADVCGRARANFDTFLQALQGTGE